jgi:hypothetical protein
LSKNNEEFNHREHREHRDNAIERKERTIEEIRRGDAGGERRAFVQIFPRISS